MRRVFGSKLAAVLVTTWSIGSAPAQAPASRMKVLIQPGVIAIEDGVGVIRISRDR